MRTRIENLQQKLEELYEVNGLSSDIYAEYNEHLMDILVNQMYTEGAVAMIDYISREVDKLHDEISDRNERKYVADMDSWYDTRYL